MNTFHMKPGPRIGYLLHALLEEVLDNPSKNTEPYLDSRTSQLLELGEAQLRDLGEAGKKRREAEEEAEIERIMSKHHVC